MKDKTGIYVVIFWMSLAVIAVWIILKATGIINSPVWVELIPFAGAIFAAGSFFQMILGMKKDLVSMKTRQNRMAHGLTKLELRFDHLKKSV